MRPFLTLAIFMLASPVVTAPIVYEGNAGLGLGKHIVFIASDHEYRSEEMWAQCGGYKADPLQPSEVLAMAQPLQGMTPDSVPNAEMPPVPGAWTRQYQGKDGHAGRVFTSTYGASNDILSEGYLRLLLNGCIWAVGLEQKITPELNVAFVGPYNPTWG